MHEETVFVNIVSFLPSSLFVPFAGVWEWIGGFDLMSPFVLSVLSFLLCLV
jgi:hypothetical protein